MAYELHNSYTSCLCLDLCQTWEPDSLKERYAPSAVELLRIVDETLDGYFALPVSQFSDLLQDLVNGIDIALKNYGTQAIGNCGKS